MSEHIQSHPMRLVYHPQVEWLLCCIFYQLKRNQILVDIQTWVFQCELSKLHKWMVAELFHSNTAYHLLGRELLL